MERRDFLRGMTRLSDHWPLAPMFSEDALPASRWTPLLMQAQVRSDSIKREAIRKYGARAIQSGAVQVGADVEVGVTFDLANPIATSYLEQRAAALVTRIDETTRGAMRDVLTQAAADQWSYNVTAQAIRDDFAFSRSRSLTIARTEMTNAYSEGSMTGARQLEDQGLTMEKAWLINAPEDEDCISNGESDWIGIDEAFPSGDDRPPVHPNCECDVIFRRAEA
jgi:hypothetical protein